MKKKIFSSKDEKQRSREEKKYELRGRNGYLLQARPASNTPWAFLILKSLSPMGYLGEFYSLNNGYLPSIVG